MEEKIWADHHVIRQCDATTGHSVRNIAFCQDAEVAKRIVLALRRVDANN